MQRFAKSLCSFGVMKKFFDFGDEIHASSPPAGTAEFETEVNKGSACTRLYFASRKA